LWTALVDQHISTPMAITAENLAEKYDITRQQCDEFAVLSNQRWKAGLSVLFKADLVVQVVLLVQWFCVGLVIERSLVQLILPSLRGSKSSTSLHGWR